MQVSGSANAAQQSLDIANLTKLARAVDVSAATQPAIAALVAADPDTSKGGSVDTYA